MQIQRCNHCMLLFDGELQECPNCGRDDALMFPVEDVAQSDFDVWWRNEGSGIVPLPGHDMEKHAERVSRIAWSNGAYKQKHPTLPTIPAAMLCRQCGRMHRLRDEDAGSDREVARLCVECFTEKGA